MCSKVCASAALAKAMHVCCRYDRQRCEAKQIKDMQLMAAMAPPGGGRNAFSQRLQVMHSASIQSKFAMHTNL